MRLSTRSRYGVRLMYEFALRYGEDYIQLGEAAKRQGISEKYLSKLVIPLKGAGLIRSFRGFHGGYSLAKAPKEISLKDIVEVLEGGIAPVECVRDKALCGRSGVCPAREIWCRLSESIKQSLKAISLKDLVDQFRSKTRDVEIDYCI